RSGSAGRSPRRPRRPRPACARTGPLWILVRHESGPHAAVLGRPAPPAVPRLERADGADPDHEVPRIPRIDEHGVEARAAVAGLPLFPSRMVVQRLDVVPRVPAIVAAEPRR